MAKRTCSIDGCNRFCEGNGLCGLHYSRMKYTGTTDAPIPKPRRGCSIDGCSEKHLAGGFCRIHYHRLRLTGMTSLPRKMKDGPCSVADCGRTAAKRGWCETHYRRWRVSGNPQEDAPVRPRRSLIVDGKKCCRECSKWLPLDSFTNQARGSGGRRNICRGCTRVYNVLYREANPDYWTDWARSHPDNVLAAVHSRRAARNGGEYETVNRSVVFERDDFTCQLCGDPLDMTTPWPAPWSASIDHIVPLSKGGDHLYSNIQAAHFRCNVVKGANLPIPA